jgi:hypothetical protein
MDRLNFRESEDGMADKNRHEGLAAFDVVCPECGGMLRIDPETRAVLAHTPAPQKRTFEDFETAARAMRESDERRELLFRQGVDAEKNREDVMAKKFAEALRKAKESPATERPLRDFDLD